jgi:protein-disulfide isomerase/uncharacterized membrane protein
MLILAAGGLAIALLQTYQHVVLTSLSATGRSGCGLSASIDCDAVYASRYSELLGVPIAAWGAAAYLALIATLLTALAARGPVRRTLATAGFGIAAVSFLASAALFTVSVGVLGVLCPLCTAVHAINLALLVSAWRALGRPFTGLTAAREGAVLGERAFYGIHALLILALAGAALGASQWVRLRLVITDPTLTLDRDLAAFLKGEKHVFDLSQAPSKGNPAAPVTIVEFGDFECPTCRSAYWLYKAVLQPYGDRVRLCFKHYPLDQKCNEFVGSTPHASACLAAKASLHAHEEGKFWEFAEALYGSDRPPDQAACEAAARAVGLSPSAMMEFVKPRSGWETIVADIKEGRAAGVRSTPAFFINGRRAEGVLVPTALRAFIDATLAEGAR